MRAFFVVLGYILLFSYISLEIIHQHEIEPKLQYEQQKRVQLNPVSLHQPRQYDSFTPEVKCLAENIYQEARNQSIDGMVAVAAVTVNRKLSREYPSTICGVVNDPYQFSWVAMNVEVEINNSIDQRAWKIAKEIAFDTLNEGVPSNMLGVYHYHADYVQPGWAQTKTVHRVIDNHIFYI